MRSCNQMSGHTAVGADHPMASYNISLGLALAPIRSLKLRLLTLALIDQEVEFHQLSHWLRSPFLKALKLRWANALLDAAIRRMPHR